MARQGAWPIGVYGEDTQHRVFSVKLDGQTAKEDIV